MQIPGFLYMVAALGVIAAVVTYQRRSGLRRAAAEEAARRADRRRVDWSIGAAEVGYVLRNDGTDSAYGVHLDHALPLDLRLDFGEFPAEYAHAFKMVDGARLAGTGQLVVTWHHRSDRTDARRRRALFFRL